MITGSYGQAPQNDLTTQLGSLHYILRFVQTAQTSLFFFLAWRDAQNPQTFTENHRDNAS